MSDDTDLGYHTFLPWLRRGIGIEISRTNDDPTPAPRATLDIGVSIGPGPLSSAPTDVSLSLYGPGDVATLDPARHSHLAASECLSGRAELLPADRAATRGRPVALYTGAPQCRGSAASVGRADRARQWRIRVRGPDRSPLHPPRTLPPLDQSFAWAHVQISGEQSVDPATVLRSPRQRARTHPRTARVPATAAAGHAVRRVSRPRTRARPPRRPVAKRARRDQWPGPRMDDR